jgi:hypothetical protein
MLTSTVLRRLKRIGDRLPARPPRYLHEALRRTEAAWERLGPVRVLLPDHAVEQLHAILQEQLTFLDANASMGMLPGAPMVRYALAYPGVLADLLERTPADLRVDVIRALADDWQSLMSIWLRDLVHGTWKLPADLSETALGAVLRVLVDQPAEKVWSGQDVCDGCGLALPLPASLKSADMFFDKCPHCGAGTR